MKNPLAVILSCLLLVVSLQEGVSAMASNFSQGQGCCASNLVEEDTCDLDLSDEEIKDDKEEACCSDGQCDCTCCVHMTLFGVMLNEINAFDLPVKDSHLFSSDYTYNSPFSIFHPPLLLA